MSKGRYRRLYESFVFGQRICSVSIGAEMFFWRLYVIADDYGNFEVEPITLAAKAGGLRKLKTIEIQGWVKEIEQAGLIKLYQSGKKTYGHFQSFVEYQVPSGPAHAPDLGMQRFCPESPWDKLPTHSMQAGPPGGNAQVNFDGVEREKKESDIKKEKSKDILFLGIKTNTRKGNNINDSGTGVGRIESRLFKDPEFFVEGTEVSDPKLHDFVREAFAYWQRKCDRATSKLTPNRLYRLKQRYKDSTIEEVKQAIDGCAKSDFHMGRQLNNPVIYNDIELICRYRHKLEQFMDKATFNPKKDSWDEKKRRSDEAKARWHSKNNK